MKKTSFINVFRLLSIAIIIFYLIILGLEIVNPTDVCNFLGSQVSFWGQIKLELSRVTGVFADCAIVGLIYLGISNRRKINSLQIVIGIILVLAILYGFLIDIFLPSSGCGW